ncbi:hypothetical protein SAMN05216371_7775 [Streptomyces sp. TLI_053]|uniref:hypothetical protein n=1 Tax=Streptomyces sp. TLI_053 TaxID=1855352 RepID=UPI00087D1342|nr:hypothetical protein [Streptomyces sp. TLI_053]SDT82963.1 hypothetical protein SAMN05216371_7775 [Streptomyces sp. TLI_053]
MPHPLTLLRTAKGLSHPAYAGLVARTHAELGLGQMAARREKVSRWESGRTVPERTAQLAMAHIHGIASDEVRRLGWPHWLDLAVGDAVLLGQLYSEAGAELALRGSLHLPTGPCAPALLLRGSALDLQVRSALQQFATPDHAPFDDVGSPAAERVHWCEARVASLERQESGTLFPVAELYKAAHAEHRLVVQLLGVRGPDSPEFRRLLGLAARTALLCSWLSSALGEETRAERHGLAAVRAAAAAGEPVVVAVAFARIAHSHLVAGDPADALALIRAARTADRAPAPGTETVLSMAEALALARQGSAVGATEALGRAAASHAAARLAATPTPDAWPGIVVHEQAVTVARGRAALLLGAPHGARPYFETLADSLTVPQVAAPSPRTAVWLLDAVAAYLALGETDLAARAVRRAVDVTGVLPPGLALQYRRRLAPYVREPAVRRVLEHLADLPGAARTARHPKPSANRREKVASGVPRPGIVMQRLI